MKLRIVLLLILPILLFAFFARANSHHAEAPASLALTHVNVIDVATGGVRPDMTVVLTADRISAIGPSATLSVPAEAQVVDATGKFLIPGLWDMHVHWYARDLFTLFIANGVTGVRQMFGNSDLLRWRNEIAKGSLIGPRMVVASPIIDGPRPVWPNSISVRNEEEGRQAVRNVKQWGADFVKVYTLLPRDAYFAIADESKRQGMTFVGHVPQTVSASEASDAGQKSIEHLTGLLLECSYNEKDLRDKILRGNYPPGRANAEANETFSEKKAADLYARFVKNQTWQCPTLTVLHSHAFADEEDLRRDARVRYIRQQLLQRWKTRLAEHDGSNKAVAKKIFQREAQITGAMQKAGVSILAGTDTGNPFCFPGFSLHEELALLVNAGLTPLDALRSATINPAKFFGLEQRLGTIESGKIADLVLLDANPLQDIRNTQRISAVIQNGRLFDRKALDRMLAEAEVAAKR